MSDRLAKLGLTSHFTNRFKQFLLFLEVTNDQELICLIISFLPLRDLIKLTSTSSYLYRMTKIQSIEIKILRAKLSLYEQPKSIDSHDPLEHYFSSNMSSKGKVSTSNKIENNFKTLQTFNKQIRSLPVKRQNGHNNQPHILSSQASKKYNELNHFNEQIHKSENIPLTQTQNRLEKQTQIRTKIYSENNKDNIQIDFKENPYIERLYQLEEQYVKQDYEHRKAKGLEVFQSSVILINQIKEFKKDPNNREILKKIIAQEKARLQQQNRAKLHMKPLPKIEKLQEILQKSTVPVPQNPILARQPIASRVFNKIKSLFNSNH